MNKQDLISVIIPNFNNCEYLDRCLQSVIEQTHSNLEIILLDDFSTDGSVGIIKQYAHDDNRVRPVFNDTNTGVAQNRHNGIILARGNYITTLDSDDIFISKHKLANELSMVRNKISEGLDNVIAFSGIVLIDKNDVTLGKSSSNIQEGFILNEILRRTCMIPRDFLFTRDQYLKAGGFDTNMPIYEDWDLKIRLAKANLFYYSGADGIGYRRHAQGLSSVSPVKHIWWLSRIFVKNFRLMQTGKTKTTWLFFRYISGMYSKFLRKRIRWSF